LKVLLKTWLKKQKTLQNPIKQNKTKIHWAVCFLIGFLPALPFVSKCKSQSALRKLFPIGNFGV